jgi:Transposase DDE domain
LCVTTNLDALLAALYVFIDDHVAPCRRIGRPPKLTDAELLCLAVAQVLLGFPSARHWIRFAHARLRHLFRYLPQQSGYTKRLNAAGPLICQVIEALAQQVPTWHDDLRLIDSTPLPCAASRETAKRSELAGHAGYGYCRSHSRFFWGLRLYLVTTAEGMPVSWCLAHPKLGEREVMTALLERDHQLIRAGQVILADKGFAGREFEAFITERLGAHLVRPDRKDEPVRHGRLARSGSGSRLSSTPSKASSAWNNTAAAPRGVRPHRPTPARPRRRDLAQLDNRSPGQTITDRLRPLKTSDSVI